MSNEPPAGRDPTLDRVGEASLRLMAGLVPKRTMQRLRERVRTSTSEYPWEEVVDAVLADPVDDSQALRQALRAQRDWVLRGGRETPRPKLKAHGKRFVAYLLSRLIFFVLYSLAAVVLLVLLKHHWDWIDIYRILDGLSELLPGLFGRGG